MSSAVVGSAWNDGGRDGGKEGGSPLLSLLITLNLRARQCAGVMLCILP